MKRDLVNKVAFGPSLYHPLQTLGDSGNGGAGKRQLTVAVGVQGGVVVEAEDE